MTDQKKMAVQMRTFLNEYQLSNGGRSAFVDLPNPGELPWAHSIIIPKEQVVKFRNDMFLLLKFAALMCDKTIEELCPFDLMAPFLELQIDWPTRGNCDGPEEDGNVPAVRRNNARGS